MDNDEMVTPEEVIAEHGLTWTADATSSLPVPPATPSGETWETGGDVWNVTIASRRGATLTTTYNRSAHDRSTGKLPDLADVLGCLLLDASYEADPDELWSELGGDHPPSYYVDLAAKLAENRAGLANLLGGADVLDAYLNRGVEW